MNTAPTSLRAGRPSAIYTSVATACFVLGRLAAGVRDARLRGRLLDHTVGDVDACGGLVRALRGGGEARSILRRSPYDPVRVVNAVP